MRLTSTLLLSIFLVSCASLRSTPTPIFVLTQPTTPTVAATATYASVPTMTMTPTPTLLPSITASQLIQKHYTVIQPDNTDYIYQLVRYHRFELESDYWEKGHNPDRMMSVAFSPKNYMLLFGSNNGAGLWDLEKYLTQPKLVEGHPVTIRDEYTGEVAFSPDGQFIALRNSFDSPQVQIVDISTLENIYPEVWLNPVNHLAFSPDGKTMGLDINLWDWHGNSAHPQRQIELPPEYIPTQFNRYDLGSITFSPDGTLIATGGSLFNSKQPIVPQYMIVLLDFNTGEVVNILGQDRNMAGIYSLSFNSKGDLLASASGRSNFDTYGGHRKLTGEGGTVRLWNVSSGTLLATLDSDEYITYTVAFSPDGSIVAAGNQDGTIKLWDTKTYKLLRIIQAHIAQTTQISFSFDGRFIASSGGDGTISVWGICGTVHEYPAENVGWQDHHYPCIEF